MDTIHIINKLDFKNEQICASNIRGKASRLFLKQGDLDGACAVYSLMMMLILHHKVKYQDLVAREKGQGYSSIKRLQDKFLSGLIGLYRGGYFFSDLAVEFRKCFKKKATVSTFGIIDNDNKVSKEELIEIIKKQLDSGNPVEIGFTRKGDKTGHAVVAIGYATRKDHLLLFCLDPGYDLACTSLWNTIIDIDMNFNNGRIYPDDEITVAGNMGKICVDEILLID